MPLDRLPRIRIDHECRRVSYIDIDWLIAEIDRLRAQPTSDTEGGSNAGNDR